MLRTHNPEIVGSSPAWTTVKCLPYGKRRECISLVSAKLGIGVPRRVGKEKDVKHPDKVDFVGKSS